MEKALSLLQEMRMAPGVSTNDAVYRSIIFASCEAGDWVTALGLVEDARRENLKPGTGNLRMIVQVWISEMGSCSSPCLEPGSANFASSSGRTKVTSQGKKMICGLKSTSQTSPRRFSREMIAERILPPRPELLRFSKSGTFSRLPVHAVWTSSSTFNLFLRKSGLSYVIKVAFCKPRGSCIPGAFTRFLLALDKSVRNA